MLRLPAPFVPHSASLSPATGTRVLSTPVPVSAPPISLDECLFSISLVLVPLAVRFSVSSGLVRRRSVSTYTAILVLKTECSVLTLTQTNLPHLPDGLNDHFTMWYCRAIPASKFAFTAEVVPSRYPNCSILIRENRDRSNM